MERLRAIVRRLGGPAVVFTFDPPPVRILRPDAVPEPLMPVDRRVEILCQLGVDVVFRSIPPIPPCSGWKPASSSTRSFAAGWAVGPWSKAPTSSSATTGPATSNCSAASARGPIPLEVVEPVEIAGQVVSSSRIRSLVMAGRLDEARRMLGRPYRIRGRVTHGAGRYGLGYPTANLGPIDTLTPGHGI